MRPFEVRAAAPEDMPGLVSLCLAARRESAVGPQVFTPDPAELACQLGALAGVPGGVLLVARTEEAAVGLLLGRVVGPNPFTDEVSLAVEALYVDRTYRRRGVGRHLMAAAAGVAAAADAGHVYATPLPGARGMQRFFVQLGFSSAASYRVCTTTALQRRLSAETAPARRTAPRGIEDLIARRRRSRLAPADSGSPDPDLPGPSDAGQARRSSRSMHVRRAVQTRLDAESTTTIS